MAVYQWTNRQESHMVETMLKHEPSTRSRHRSGASALGLTHTETAQLIHEMERGLPYSSIARFHAESGLSVGTIADLIRIPPRTLIRRKASGRLDTNESERLLRISNVFEKAVGLFGGDRDSARTWLMTPNRALAHRSPLDFSRTEIGAREAEDLIGRLEHGVFT
jgi:putative toxin-antitoxin system antitoxin component (TIGR02293 family)